MKGKLCSSKAIESKEVWAIAGCLPRLPCPGGRGACGGWGAPRCTSHTAAPSHPPPLPPGGGGAVNILRGGRATQQEVLGEPSALTCAGRMTTFLKKFLQVAWRWRQFSSPTPLWKFMTYLFSSMAWCRKKVCDRPAMIWSKVDGSIMLLKWLTVQSVHRTYCTCCRLGLRISLSGILMGSTVSEGGKGRYISWNTSEIFGAMPDM